MCLIRIRVIRISFALFESASSIAVCPKVTPIITTKCCASVPATQATSSQDPVGKGCDSVISCAITIFHLCIRKICSKVCPQAANPTISIVPRSLDGSIGIHATTNPRDNRSHLFLEGGGSGTFSLVSCSNNQNSSQNSNKSDY